MHEIDTEAGTAEVAAAEGALGPQGLKKRIRQAQWAVRQPMSPSAREVILAELAADLRAIDKIEGDREAVRNARGILGAA